MKESSRKLATSLVVIGIFNVAWFVTGPLNFNEWNLLWMFTQLWLVLMVIIKYYERKKKEMEHGGDNLPTGATVEGQTRRH